MATKKKRRRSKQRGGQPPLPKRPESRVRRVLALVTQHATALGLGLTAIATIVGVMTFVVDVTDAPPPDAARPVIVGDRNVVAAPHSVVNVGVDAAEVQRLVSAAVEGVTGAYRSALQAADADNERLREQLREQLASGFALAAAQDPGRAHDALERVARGDADTAKTMLEALAAREEAAETSKSRQVDALLALAALFHYSGHARESLDAVERAIALGPAAASAWKLQGSLLLDMDRAKDALASFEKVVEFAKASSNRALEAAGQHGLGLAYKDLDELDRAQQALERALELDRDLGEVVGIAADYGGLGLVYRRQGRLEKAEQAYLDALEINDRLGRAPDVAVDCLNLGALYGKANELDEAERYFGRARAIFEQLGDRRGQAESQGNLGKVYTARGNFAAAERALLEAVAVAQELGLGRDAATGHASLGELYERMGEPRAAREHYERARQLHAELGGSSQQLEHTRKRPAVVAR